MLYLEKDLLVYYDPLLLQVKGGETNYRYKSNLKVETRTLEEVKRVLEYVSGSKTRLTGIMLDHMVVYH
ncbi:unnamed protein product [Brassica napus]|uniref:(rape) hypothetical protein n=1 Tax=Brassica napus TaxID=3708 RepID=A0A816MGC1_BRANA|nr:unnamed protein product [Brassica napus]